MGFWSKLGDAVTAAARFHLVSTRMKSVADVDCTFRVVQHVRGQRRQATAQANSRMVTITAELVDVLDNDELAWILGHELAHLQLRHGERLQAHIGDTVDSFVDTLRSDHARRRRRGQGTFSRGLQTLAIGALGGVAASALAANKQQSHEFEADALASVLARKAGFNPGAGAAVLKKVHRGVLPRQGILERIFSTHPDTQARIRKLEGLGS